MTALMEEVSAGLLEDHSFRPRAAEESRRMGSRGSNAGKRQNKQYTVCSQSAGPTIGLVTRNARLRHVLPDSGVDLDTRNRAAGEDELPAPKLFEPTET
jgi:hypothetical protein